MDTRPEEDAPFDERRALAELERVRDQIQAYRAQRRAVQDEFGRFVRSFKEPQPIVTPDPPASTSPAAGSSAPMTPHPPAPPPPVHMPAPPAPAPAARPSIGEEQTPAIELEPFPAAAPPAPGRTAAIAAVAALLLLAFGAWIFWPQSGDTPAAVEDVPRAAESGASTAPTAPAPAAAPTRSTELVTIRAVWMRVIVDGTRVMEREVPADTKIPLNPRESLVVRAGDGAAVRLTLAGEDQGLLGREGLPVTRTFTMPAERR